MGKRFPESKSLLREALPSAALALQQRTDDSAEELVHGIVDEIHRAHELTDDRTGLQDFIPGLEELLQSLRAASGPEVSAPVPLIRASEKAPVDENLSLRARLLERIVLICIATGQTRATELVKKVYMDF